MNIYPEVQITESEDRLELSISTNLRKEQDGVWYLMVFNQKWRGFVPFTGDAKLAMVSKLHKNVYEAIIMGRINKKLMIAGRLLFEIDVNQTSEAERLQKTFLL